MCLQINYLPSLGPRFHQFIEEAEHPWRFFKIPSCSHLLWFHWRMFIFPNTCMLHAKSLQFSSVQFSCSVVSDSMDCSKPVHDQSLTITNSQSLLKLISIELDGCHPTISFSVILFSCLPSFPASGSFQMSQFFASGGQSIGVSASASVLPMNIQD